MKAIADMGFLVAFGNRKDYHHGGGRSGLLKGSLNRD
jgi:hypothetical protein